MDGSGSDPDGWERVMEMSILNHQTNQLMESYNETVHQISRYASISSFSNGLNQPCTSMADLSYRSQMSRRPWGLENGLPAIQERSVVQGTEARIIFDPQLVSKSISNGDKSNMSTFRSRCISSKREFAPSASSNPLRHRFRMPDASVSHGQESLADRGINSSSYRLPGMLKARELMPALLATTERSENLRDHNGLAENRDEGYEDDVVIEVSTKKSPKNTREQEADDLFATVSDCDSVEGGDDEVTVVPRKKSSDDSSIKKKCKKVAKKPIVTPMILKNWSVALKGGDLVLIGKLCDKKGQVLDPNHISTPVQCRKRDGSISTKRCAFRDGQIYILDGAPAWERSTDPPPRVNKFFESKFPNNWRQVVKLWKLESTKRKKASVIPQPSSKTAKNKAIRQGSATDQDSSSDYEISSLAKRPKIKQHTIKNRNEPLKSTKRDNKKKPEARKPATKKSGETKKGAEAEVFNQDNDMFAQLNLDIPKIAFSAVTPTTFGKVISKNAVRIGAHTPTLKTFADEHPSSLTVSPDPAPSKPKKNDVVSIRLAKAIESGREPSGSRKNGGSKKNKNGTATVSANKKAIDEIINSQKNRPGRATPKFIRKIQKGFDDSNDSFSVDESESEVESERTESD